jgi:hypothetical protein
MEGLFMPFTMLKLVNRHLIIILFFKSRLPKQDKTLALLQKDSQQLHPYFITEAQAEKLFKRKSNCLPEIESTLFTRG